MNCQLCDIAFFEGELIYMEITDKEYKSIVDYVKSNYGINLNGKKTLITGRLQNYLVKNGYSSYSEFLDKVKSSKTGEEANKMLNYLTTNHTYFLREQLHFNYLRDVVLPFLLKKESATKSIKLWSCACSTGEEPYTIVMTMEDFFKSQPGKWDTRILATDISTQVLGKAREGIYLNEQLEVLPDRWRKMYFQRHSDVESRVKDEIRNKVIYKQFNLMSANYSFKSKFNVIFIRNVMIYFDEQTKRQIVDKMYNCLDIGGYLFTGMAEVVDKTATKLKYIQPSIYQKIN